MRLSVFAARRASTLVKMSTPRKPSSTSAPAPNRLAIWYTTFSTLESKPSVGKPSRTVTATISASRARLSRDRSRSQNLRSSSASRARRYSLSTWLASRCTTAATSTSTPMPINCSTSIPMYVSLNQLGARKRGTVSSGAP